MKEIRTNKIYSINIFASIAAFFALLGLILSFLPLRMFAIIPAIIAIYFAVIAYILTRVFKTKKTFVYIIFGIAVLSIAVASITESVSTNVVVEDKEFEQKLDNQTKDVDSSLIAAFEEEIIPEKPKTTATDTTAKLKEKQEPAQKLEEEFVEEKIGDVEF